MTLYNYSFLSRKQQAMKLSFCVEQIIHLLAPGSAGESLKVEYSKLLGYAEKFKEKIGAGADWPGLPGWDGFQASAVKEKTALVTGLRYRILDAAGIPQPESDFSTPFTADSPDLPRRNLIVLVDNVRSPFNIGSIIRTAEAFGFREIVLTGIAAASNQKKVLRAAMSADNHLKILRLSGLPETTSWLSGKRGEGWTVVSVEKTDRSTVLTGRIPGDRAILIVGNEEFGISDPLLALSDRIVHIPLTGFKNSLNVAVAFGIAAHAAIGDGSGQGNLNSPPGIEEQAGPLANR